MKKTYSLLVAALLLQSTGWTQTNTPSFDTIYQQRKMPAWFNEAKFGVFIVWGVYSVPGWAPKGQYAERFGHNILDGGSAPQKYHERVWGKNFTYDQFVPLLTGEGFNADDRTSLIQKAGATVFSFRHTKCLSAILPTTSSIVFGNAGHDAEFCQR
jgi:alpha-L-fucosidase